MPAFFLRPDGHISRMSKNNAPISSLDHGRTVIKEATQDLPQTPGVYRMLSAQGDVLYVGKAKALKRRVLSYTQIGRLPVRLQRMVALTASMEFVHTHTEAEALLLEANLIKKLKPRFNILLRDDKSFPYIHLRRDHDYPMVVKYRGKKQKDGQYFGPFASAGDVNRVLKALQRVFMLRNCTDHNFAARTRPCLQYHIKRCTAPCVDYVSHAEYAEQVDEAKAFLEGKSDALQERFRNKMQAASDDMDYETAAQYRDRLKALMAVQARQTINFNAIGDADVIALAEEAGRTCIQVFFFRAGQNYGNHAYFPRYEGEVEPSVLMETFIAQFYVNKPAPKHVFVSIAPDGSHNLAQSLSEIVQHKVTITCPQRGEKKDAVDFAMMNAREALARHVSKRQSENISLEAIADLFDMDAPPKRIEVYDNSHIAGSHMVGAMVVSGEEGFEKGAYRKFNIREAAASDDYGMMREVMQRRFRKAQEGELQPGADDWPDLLLIDGGKGQLSAVTQVLEDIGILADLTVVAIAKGEDRNAGRERFFMNGRSEFSLPPNDPVLYYLQRLRDEAHRYAVSSHQMRRKKAIKDNALDNIEGVGAKKRAALIRYFGSAKAVENASMHDLQKVEGISANLAQAIYDYFHEK